MELIWKCLKCGYIYLDPNASPERCPVCGAPKEEFVRIEED